MIVFKKCLWLLLSLMLVIISFSCGKKQSGSSMSGQNSGEIPDEVADSDGSNIAPVWMKL